MRKIKEPIALTPEALSVLKNYASLVWRKKGDLNLTAAESETEIWQRHITDGLYAAALIKELAGGLSSYSVADYGCGCGYIGFSVKAALGESCDLTLVETLGKRCLFMDWCIMRLGLKGARTLNVRAKSSGGAGPFDFTMERAMGKINDILPICCADLKSGGYFIAFQSQADNWDEEVLKAVSCLYEEDLSLEYTLPSEEKNRYLLVFRKI